MADEDIAVVYDEAQSAMDKSVRKLQTELQKLRTGRASTALLDSVKVDYYGSPTPLNQLANMSTPDPRLIVISPFDKAVIGDIEKAILASDLGLTPGNDGKVVRIPVPALTEDRRKELVKHLHRVAEDHKVGVREGRRDALSMLKDLKTSGDISEDDLHREEKRIQGLTDDHTKQIDEIASAKEEEILQV